MFLRRALVAGSLIGVGVVLLPSPASAGNIRSFAGTTYEDLDGDGQFEVGEPAIQGCTVSLDSNSDGSVDQTDSTDADGDFSFQQAGTAAATITATCPGDLENQAGPLVFPAGNSVPEIEIPFFEPGQVFGDTFNDLDGDGVLDGGETFIDGCTVTLDVSANGTVEDDVLTVDGFAFPGLPAGPVRLRATCPGLTQTTADPADIVVTSGLDQGGILFGFRAQAATTSTTATVVPSSLAITSTTRVLARTGATPSNGGLGLLGIGLLAAGGGLVVVASRRRAAA